MRKPYKHSEVSERVCLNCSKKLKKNLLSKQPDASCCYDCHSRRKGKGKYRYSKVKK